MTYRIELGRPSNDNLVELAGTDVSSPSVDLTHSQLSKWSFDTHYDPGFTQYAEIFAPMRLYWSPPIGSDRVLFRGEVVKHKRVDGGPGSNAHSRLEGHCRGFTTLRRDAPLEIVEYSNIAPRDAIADYWANYTPYDATVHDQPLDDLPPITSAEFTDDHLSNLQKLHERAGFIFTIDHSGADLSVTSMARGQVTRDAAWELDGRAESTATNVEHEDDRRDYANIVIGLGATGDDGDRMRWDAVNTTEIQRLRDAGCPPGTSCAVAIVSDPDAETLDEVQTMAETELSKRVEESKTKGKIDVIPTWVQPGFAYDVAALGEDGLTLESISFNIGGTDANATLEFIDRYGYARDVATLRGQIHRIKHSL